MIARFVLLITLHSAISLNGDYYWREYTGEIPEDAIIGGQDINNKDIYIGQAFLKGEGLIVSEIFKGKKEVEAPFAGVKKIDSYIKILCGVQLNFIWENATASNLHIQLLNKTPVLGGHEGGVLFVGRINYEGTTKIEKIASFNNGDAKMFFAYKGQEKSSDSYQVLLYNSNFDIRLPLERVPHDAVIGGQDSAEKNIDISQVYLKGEGLLVASMTEGEKVQASSKFFLENHADFV